MTRRIFIGMALALLAPAAWVAPKRWREALRVRQYPGPVRPLDPDAIGRPGKWAG